MLRSVKNALALSLIVSLFFATTSFAAVKVVQGPTPIPSSDAVHAEDLTISNEFMAVSLAVGTSPPWGVAKKAAS